MTTTDAESIAISEGKCPECGRPLVPWPDTQPDLTGGLCTYDWALFETNRRPAR